MFLQGLTGQRFGFVVRALVVQQQAKAGLGVGDITTGIVRRAHPAAFLGINCWDLNGNGIKDPEEDINGDGLHDALDCRGGGEGSFDGILQGRPLIIRDNAGNEVFRVNPDGTSFHDGLETFNGGLVVPVPDIGDIEFGEFGAIIPLPGNGAISLSEDGISMLGENGENVFHVKPDGPSSGHRAVGLIQRIQRLNVLLQRVPCLPSLEEEPAVALRTNIHQKNGPMKALRLLFSLFLLVVFAQVALAQNRMNFQGQLNNADGTPANGEFSVRFSLYNDSLGGAPLLTQTQRLRILEGFFNTSLNVRSIRFDTLYWVGLAIDGGAELRPRLPLFSSPYSFSTRSLFGETNVVPSSGNAGFGTRRPRAPLHVVGDVLFENLRFLPPDSLLPLLVIDSLGILRLVQPGPFLGINCWDLNGNGMTRSTAGAAARAASTASCKAAP